MQTWLFSFFVPPPTRLGRIGPVFLAVGLAFVAGCRPSVDHATGVQLILIPNEVIPGITFELRFDEPMAHTGNPDISPLVFDPPVRGAFTWTSPRSGVFIPAEPLALDTAYHARLRAGLKREDGQLSRARLRRRLVTPPFAVTASDAPNASTNAFSEPEIKLWFNADVPAAHAAPHAGFTSADGQFIPATARQGTARDDFGSWRSGGESRTWQTMFNLVRNPPSGERAMSADESDEDREIPNLVILSPTHPLTTGTGWKFKLSAQVASADGRYRTREPFETELGDVAPFLVHEATMHHELSKAPWLEIRFSKNPPELLTNTFQQWIQIEPSPGPLAAEIRGRSLLLSGPWLRGPKYVATVLRGLPADEDFSLPQSRTLEFVVPPVQPRLYFPAFSADQLASGNRTFPVLAVNVPRIRVRAKLLEDATAIHALRGYRGYYQTYNTTDNCRLDYDLVPGRTTFSQTVPGSQQPDVADQVTLHWDTLLDARKTGVAFLEAEEFPSPPYGSPTVGAQAIVQLTDLGLVWKTTAGQAQAFVFSYQTGLPLPGVRVRLCSEENETLAETATDPSGFASLPSHEHARWLIAQTTDDLHAVSLHQQNIPSWSFEATRWRSENQDPRRIALFLDRGAYRPGETAFLKAIVRDLSDQGLKIPAGITGQLACLDPRGRQFFQTNLVLSPLGSCETAIPLPLNRRGRFAATLRLPDAEAYQDFHVADFQPPAFEVQLRSLPAYGPQQEIELELSAKYFFGKPLDHARVKWWLSGEDQPFTSDKYKEFQFARAWEETRWNRSPSTHSTEGETTLTNAQPLLVKPFESRLSTSSAKQPMVAGPARTSQLSTLNSQLPQPRHYQFLAEVTDLNQQTITRSTTFTRHSSTFYLGLKRPNCVLQPGDPLPVEAIALRTDGQPWPHPVDARLALYRIEWNTVRLQGAGRSVRYRSDPILHTNLVENFVLNSVASDLNPHQGRAVGQSGSDPKPPSTGSITSAKQPTNSQLSTLNSQLLPGEYLLEITANDDQGNPVACSVTFSVADRATLAWDYRNEFELQLVPDKPTYAPGDTAVLLAKAPFSGRAWVTVERDRILRSFQTELHGNAPAIQIPILPGDAPNVFVSVTLVRGADQSPHQVREPEYRAGYCELKIEDPATRLTVTVAPVSTNCQPGDPVVVDLQTLDFSGKPAPETEITLYAVDEGVLSLTDYAAPDLHALMLAPCALRVGSSISLPFLITEDPTRLRFQNKGYTGGGGGKEALRQRFLACAFWAGSLLTDAQGKATARFNAPDSITRYRLIAVAHNARNQFGTGTAALSVSKPLILEPALPQVANLGDRLLARALILNQTDVAAPVFVSLELDDKARCDLPALTNTVLVPAQSSATVDFPVTLSATGPAAWTWRARFTPPGPFFTDAVRSTLQVGHPSPALREVQTLRLVTPQTNLLALVNPQLLTGTGTVTVHVATTRLVTLGAAINHLLHYPYGCAEQTGSSLLPWIVLHQNPELLPLIDRDSAEATNAAHAGIQRLLSMQTPAGGLSYWPGGHSPMPWASAYGAFVLAHARQAGLPVPEAEFNSLLDYLQSETCNLADADPEAACLALAALATAGRPDPALHTRWFEKRQTLSAENRALIALAIARGEPDKSLALTLLKAPPAKLNHLDPFGSPDRERAIRLLALLACDPKSPEPEKLFQELRQSQKQGHWSTTQANAWALLAMTTHLRTCDTAAPEAAASLLWADQRHEFKLTPSQPLLTRAFSLDTNTAALPLLLSSPATNLFVQFEVASRLPAGATPNQAHGFQLRRQYQKLDNQNQPHPADSLQVGDRVLVTLQLSSPEPAQYVALDDPLPGILEAVNPEFKTQQVSGLDPDLSWPGSYREIRADRVLFFADDLRAGNYTLRYVTRVRAAGQTVAPPAKAEQMYDPQRFALTEPATLTSASSK